MFFANVTSSSKKAEEYMATSDADVWLPGKSNMRGVNACNCVVYNVLSVVDAHMQTDNKRMGHNDRDG